MTGGFLLAMQGSVTLSRAGARRPPRLLNDVWFVVSRCGPDNRLLLIGWSARQAGEHPPTLVPRVTLVAERFDAFRSDGMDRYALRDGPPPGLLLAGLARPARGVVRLAGTRPSLSLVLQARLRRGLRCHIVLSQRAWFGETTAGPADC